MYIDYQNKTVTIDEAVNIKVLKDLLKTKFPEDWKQFTILIGYNTIYYPDIKPWWQDPITVTFSDNSGEFLIS